VTRRRKIMKKIFLILFIMSFVIGSIWAEKNSTIRIDHSNIHQLPEKPNLNRTYEWYEYADILEATNLNWPTPERATFFEIWDFCISGPVTIEQVSHVFYEHPDHLWPDATFHFSGHPSSMSTSNHDGHSYNGSAGAFTFYPGFEYITGVYLEGTPTGARVAVTPDSYDFGGVVIGNSPTMTFVIENYCPTGEIIIDPAPDLTGDAVFTIISDTGAPYPTTIPTGQTTMWLLILLQCIIG
jgi:hypothetical protein